MKTRGTTKFIIFTSLLLLMLAVLLYTINDNRRLIVVQEEIILERLPPSFDGLRILQISDLHGSVFGEAQADLIEEINSLPYDMLVFTGDMNASTSAGDTLSDSQAVLDLLDGIANKDIMFWIDGNSGPYAIKSVSGAMTGRLTPIGEVLQEKGCIILMQPQSIQRGGDTIWITPTLSEIEMDAHYRSKAAAEGWSGEVETDRSIWDFYQAVYASFLKIQGNDEVKIALSHYPFQTNLSPAEIEAWGTLDYDLILAGHYHGGQIRLPLLGAVYIPSPTTGINNSGFFPDQSAVKGISYFGVTPQYVSAGLGASAHTPLLSFRLFNPPEINLITLRTQ